MDEDAGIEGERRYPPQVFLTEGYRQQAAGKGQEAEAEQWCEQLIREVE